MVLLGVTDPEHAGFKIVNWINQAKAGELLPSGVLIVILFIVFAPLLGMIIAYFMSLWLMYSSKKKYLPKNSYGRFNGIGSLVFKQRLGILFRY